MSPVKQTSSSAPATRRFQRSLSAARHIQHNSRNRSAKTQTPSVSTLWRVTYSFWSRIHPAHVLLLPPAWNESLSYIDLLVVTLSDPLNRLTITHGESRRSMSSNTPLFTWKEHKLRFQALREIEETVDTFFAEHVYILGGKNEIIHKENQHPSFLTQSPLLFWFQWLFDSCCLKSGSSLQLSSFWQGHTSPSSLQGADRFHSSMVL